MNADLRLFGSIPTLVLQQYFRSPFLDYMGAFFYSLHFVLPVTFAFVLWKFYPKNYGGYTLTLVVGTYAALITFLFYPVAPPWSGVNAVRILFQLDQHLGVPFYRTIFDFVQSNPFAAFPSLHAMYPWLISLYAFKIVRVKALPVLVLPFGVWFSAVYLGEHYVVDVIGGVVYGTLAFLFVEAVIPFIVQRRSNGLARVERKDLGVP
jgi:membrane-associated phospholipid phosphatase